MTQTLRRTRPVFGHVIDIDFSARTLSVLGRAKQTSVHEWDRLVLAPESVTRQFDIPGVAEHARGLKTLEEATLLRNHVLAQLDVADSTSTPCRAPPPRSAWPATGSSTPFYPLVLCNSTPSNLKTSPWPRPSRRRSTANIQSGTSTRRKELGMTTEPLDVNQGLAERGYRSTGRRNLLRRIVERLR
jgi:hypothetical protein